VWVFPHGTFFFREAKMTHSPLLDRVSSPADLKALGDAELGRLAY